MTDEPQRDDNYSYSFCPYDGSRLSLFARRQDKLATCEKCGFVDYGNPRPCVAVILEEAGRVLLACRGVEPAKGMWDIPGGFVDASESAEQTVSREILEETGLCVANIRYLGSCADVYGPRGVPTINLCFVATPAGGDLRAASDVEKLCWFLPADVPKQLAFRHQHELLSIWQQQFRLKGGT